MKKTAPESKTVEAFRQIIDCWFYDESASARLDELLKMHIDIAYQREAQTPGEIEVRTHQNQLIQMLLQLIDCHPLAVRDGHTSKLRTLVWKYSGIRCDNFSKLDIRGGVRFDNAQGGNLAHFNPANITILTGGKKVFITGLRADTYLDGTGPITIYGSFNCASGVNIFTHDHDFKDPDRSLFEQGRPVTHTFIYPECFIGESVFIFGSLNTRNVAAPKTVTRLGKSPEPFAVIGGIGSGFGVKKALDSGVDYPPEYLRETIENIRTAAPEHAEHLDRYVDIVREFLANNRTDWPDYQQRITQLEFELLNR